MTTPAPILDLIEGFRRSKVLFVAMSFNLFDRLHDASASLPQLASELAVSVDGLERLLDACVGLELLQKDRDLYTNLPVANTYLWGGSPLTLSGYIRYSDSALYALWGNLEAGVREGNHQWERTFGDTGGSLFSNFFRSDESKRDFLAGMNGMGSLSSPDVVAAFDLSPYSRLVDLGGGTGHLPIAACERYPNLRGVVFDLPAVVPVAREYIAKSPASARMEVIEGDFFTGELPKADLYSLGRILHDWGDHKALLLLKKIQEALPEKGALLIGEKLLSPGKTGPVSAQLQSLSMLLCTEGKERNLSEYSHLLHQAGFSTVAAKLTGKPVDAILALK